MTEKIEKLIEAALIANLRREEKLNSQNTDLHLQTRKALAEFQNLRDAARKWELINGDKLLKMRDEADKTWDDRKYQDYAEEVMAAFDEIEAQ